MVTGVSGSGKSSLVFDTLFGEAQRRLLTHDLAVRASCHRSGGSAQSPVHHRPAAFGSGSPAACCTRQSLNGRDAIDHVRWSAASDVARRGLSGRNGASRGRVVLAAKPCRRLPGLPGDRTPLRRLGERSGPGPFTQHQGRCHRRVAGCVAWQESARHPRRHGHRRRRPFRATRPGDTSVDPVHRRAAGGHRVSHTRRDRAMLRTCGSVREDVPSREIDRSPSKADVAAPAGKARPCSA